MTMPSVRRFLCVFCIAAPLFSQTSTGTIVGSVTDPSGAAVANSRITVRHLATGELREVISNERGEFSAPFLRIGEYSVTTTAQGFKTKVVSPIIVRVDQTVDLPVQLDIGTVSESVEVTAATPLLDSATSSLGQVIENKKIIDLPLNGRNAFALGLLAGTPFRFQAWAPTCRSSPV